MLIVDPREHLQLVSIVLNKNGSLDSLGKCNVGRRRLPSTLPALKKTSLLDQSEAESADLLIYKETQKRKESLVTLHMIIDISAVNYQKWKVPF